MSIIKLTKGPKSNRPVLALSQLTADNDAGDERLVYGGLNGPVTFPNNNDLVTKAKQIDLDTANENISKNTADIETNASSLATNVQQLGLKTDKTYSDAQLLLKRDKSILIPLADFAQDAKTAMTGGSVAVVGENSVQEINVVDKQITPRKTSFVTELGIELYNINTLLADTSMNFTTGATFVATGTSCTDFIPVDELTNYAINNDKIITFSASKTFINSISSSTNIFSIPVNAKYIRFVFLSTTSTLKYCQKGIKKLPNYIEISKKNPLEFLTGDIINSRQSLIYFDKNNLFNILNNYIMGKAINSSAGTLVTNADFSVTDYIELLPNTVYIKNSFYTFAFYDTNKIYISGNPSANFFTTPSNCKYIRFSFMNTQLIEDVIINIGNVILTPTKDTILAVNHTDITSSTLIRRDIFTYSTNEIIEKRTYMLNTDVVKTYKYNLNNFETEVI